MFQSESPMSRSKEKCISQPTVRPLSVPVQPLEQMRIHYPTPSHKVFFEVGTKSRTVKLGRAMNSVDQVAPRNSSPTRFEARSNDRDRASCLSESESPSRYRR